MTDLVITLGQGSYTLSGQPVQVWRGRKSIFERAESALAALSDVPRAMSRMLMTGGVLPDVYLVFDLPNAAPAAHFDDQEAARNYQVSVRIYSRAGLARLPNVDGAMTAAGFTRSSERAIQPQGEHYALEKTYFFHDEESIL